MAKAKMKSVFFCKECGYEATKWMGQCPACKEWNTIIEETINTGTRNGLSSHNLMQEIKPVKISDINTDNDDRISSGMEEFDRVLGGGIVPGSLVLVGGDPGIGKSTLLLQMCRLLSLNRVKVLYISGEESLSQIKMRAMRLGNFDPEMELLSETNLDSIAAVMEKNRPEIVIIDSIQTMFNPEVSGSAGSISQVRESTGILLNLSKKLEISIFIVGHVTKEGMVAGPRILEHMVDTVLYFEGDRHVSYRILRAVKNRFGSTNEIGVFEMRGEGLVQVKNPSEYMLEGKVEGTPGNVTVCAMEGTRPILIEIQSLVCQTSFGIPRRQTSGADINRVNLLMAVLEKRIGLKLGNCDAYVNVAGGMKITEPAIDLGIAMAIASGYFNIPLPSGMVVVGEVGLGGEVRSIGMIEQRVSEASKMGFDTVVVPKSAYDRLKGVKNCKIIGVESVSEAISIIKKNG